MENISFLGTQFTLYEMAFFFIVYSFVGWLIEIVYMTLELGYFENRGMLSGPVCPIYGFGMVLIIICLTPFIHSALLIFLVSMVLCTTLELAVGLLLEHAFSGRWWDYSNEKFNFKGLICLKVSILWGLGCLLIMRIVQPTITKILGYIPLKAGKIGITVVMLLIIADAVIAILTVVHLNRRLRRLDEISRRLRIAADAIGENLSDEVLDLKATYNKLLEKKDLAAERLIKAFPAMRSNRYGEYLDAIKQRLFRKNQDAENTENNKK